MNPRKRVREQARALSQGKEKSHSKLIMHRKKELRMEISKRNNAAFVFSLQKYIFSYRIFRSDALFNIKFFSFMFNQANLTIYSRN